MEIAGGNKMEIEYISCEEMLIETASLCEKIQLTYGLSTAKPEFIKYLANTLKKGFKIMTFEQINLAFEYNSCGYLKKYLPGGDDKVKFNIPDIIKIIKAYANLKGIGKELKESEKDESEIMEIHKKWLAHLNEIFINYMDNFVKEKIQIPYYYCKYLVRIGLLDETSINHNEAKFNSGFGGRTDNEDLIYKAFENILSNGETLEKYLI